MIQSPETGKEQIAKILKCFARFRKNSGAMVSLTVVLTLMLCVSNVHAAKVSSRSKQKAIAEAERSDLHKKLSALKKDIDRTSAAKDNAADTLAQSEAAISDANRSLHDLTDEQSQTITKLAQLTEEQTRLREIVVSQQVQLAKLIRTQYIAGNEDRIKLLLSGDNPNRISRDLQYMGYLSQAQAALIASLQSNLRSVEKKQSGHGECQRSIGRNRPRKARSKVTTGAREE